MRPVKHIGETKELKTVLEPGVYPAFIIEYSGKTWNGKYSFRIIFDVDYGGDDYLRVLHYLNPKWQPTIFISNIAGWICGDNYLKNVTPDAINSKSEVSGVLNRNGCTLLLSRSTFTERNEVLGIYPAIDVKTSSTVITPVEAIAKTIEPEDDVPF